MTINELDLAFIVESNMIERIKRPPTEAEIAEFERFLKVEDLRVADLEKFVEVYQGGAILREFEGLNVRVGSYYPPPGGPRIKASLIIMVKQATIFRGNEQKAWEYHVAYEKLHPFTDGNGRSGRMLWRWMMPGAPLGFLHQFYYQTLAEMSK